MVLVKCVLSLSQGHSCRVVATDISLSLRRAVTPGSNPLQRGWGYGLVPEVFLFREMPMGPRYFWECRACLGYSLEPKPILKKALCHTCLFGELYDKYHFLLIYTTSPYHSVAAVSRCFFFFFLFFIKAQDHEHQEMTWQNTFLAIKSIKMCLYSITYIYIYIYIYISKFC